MNWPDQFADQIIKSGKHKPYHVDDMKTPSGQVHVGALRGVIIHDLVYKALLKRGKKAVYTYVFNDMDPMDGFPHYLPENFKQYMGRPLYKIPSPEKGYQSLAECYAKQFEKVFNELGSYPQIIWSSKLYASGKMDELVRTALDRVEKVRELYHEISGYDKPKNWYPYQVVCPKCGKVGSTIVTGWDGKEVEFECKKDLVTWAEGCSYKGTIEPKGVNGKLMWKVDWAAHWKVLGITIESSGKDHMSKGGSHDLSGAISEKVFEYKTPFAFLYEWFLAKGGAKMSSSKGVGISAVEIGKTLPPEILHFLLEKTHYKKAIIFDPSNNESILKLFDDYDKTQKNKNLPRFRDVANYVQQTSVDIYKQFPKADRKELDKRIKYAKIWLDTYAPEDKKVGVLTDQIETNLSADQQKYLKLIVKLLDKDWQPEELQQELYQTAKDNQIKPKEAFQAIYLSLTGKNYGPKAAWFLLENQNVAKNKFSNLDKLTSKESTFKSTKTGLIKLSPEFVKAYPSASVGFALIEGVEVVKFNAKLEEEKQEFVKNLTGLTTEELSQSPELLSYRKMYKQMGIDWHSKRPSPEALLRRIATGKGLYPPINTAVDAYNLIVMKNRVSCGAFDADKVKQPSEIRIAQGGESALFIGDKEPTIIKAGEVCYFDQIGAYNIDYNYRDAIRSLATEKTKNIWVNAEGVFDISPEQVKKTLNEAVEIIIKYCGGQLKEKGMLVAKNYD